MLGWLCTLGMASFLSQLSAKLDLEKEELKLLDFRNYNQGSLNWRACEATRTNDHCALISSTINAPDNRGESTSTFRRCEGTQKSAFRAPV